jgi:hypothetical protein
MLVASNIPCAITAGQIERCNTMMRPKAIAVGEDVFERHGGERTAGGELHVAVKAVLIFLDGVQRELRIHDAELDDDADAQGDLVGGENFLAFDGEVAFTHVHERDFNLRALASENAFLLGNFVASGFEGFGEHAVFVPESAMGVLNYDFTFSHRI